MAAQAKKILYGEQGLMEIECRPAPHEWHTYLVRGWSGLVDGVGPADSQQGKTKHVRNVREDLHTRGPLLRLKLASSREASLGFRIYGGEADHLGGLFVDQIMPRSPAAAAGLEIGDRLISLDNTCLVGMTHAEAANTLRAARGRSCHLIVQRIGGVRQ